MYKGLIIFLIVSIIQNAHGGEIPAELKEPAVALHALCQQQSGVSEDVIQAAGNNNFMDDQALKCYLKCVWETMGAMSADGVINVESLIKALPPDFAKLVEATVRKCATLVGSDPCDNAYVINKCLSDNDPVNYFVI